MGLWNVVDKVTGEVVERDLNIFEANNFVKTDDCPDRYCLVVNDVEHPHIGEPEEL